MEKPRTLLGETKEGSNQNIFALVLGYTRPIKTKGSDYTMQIEITDESLKPTKKTVNLQVFFSNLKGFPKYLTAFTSILIIPKLTVKTITSSNSSFTNYLLDRKSGMYIFNREPLSSSYAYKEAISAPRYVFDLQDTLHISSLHKAYSIPLSLLPFSLAKKRKASTIYAYVKRIDKQKNKTVLTLIDPLNETLSFQIEDPEERDLPKRQEILKILDLKKDSFFKQSDRTGYLLKKKHPFNWKKEESLIIQQAFSRRIGSEAKLIEAAIKQRVSELQCSLSPLIQSTQLSQIPNTVPTHLSALKKLLPPPSLDALLAMLPNTYIFSIYRSAPLLKELLSLPIRRIYTTKDQKHLEFSKFSLSAPLTEQILTEDIAITHKNKCKTLIIYRQLEKTKMNIDPFLLWIRAPHPNTPQPNTLYAYLDKGIWAPQSMDT
ncbi:hypothetical protein NEFER03_0043 [Nematocida sp. LUAm3]|nr:hypothetical protein NEFER03_0043 [Nematocida sp. LUAm3]KAI5176259.1 hypothetical protein NEFER02_2056 [Nematocida sp. LUAm2]KAI5176717.1 hypothetical protein NEFER01_0042 [Nematocida sp. LUAm1]